MLVEEFASWLRQWFSKDEVKAIVNEDWTVKDGVKTGGKCIMNVEEFLHLATLFTVEKVFGNRGRKVKVVAKYNEVYALDIETKTIVVAAAYDNSIVSASHLNNFLRNMAEQAEEARDSYMGIRSVVC